MFVSMCFKTISKVVKYRSTCRLRRYNYTHDQLNTRHYIRVFLGFFFEKGGGAKFKFAPGRQIPSLRHCELFTLNSSIHSYNTRNKDKIRSAYGKHKFMNRNFRFISVHVWNTLPVTSLSILLLLILRINPKYLLCLINLT